MPRNPSSRNRIAIATIATAILLMALPAGAQDVSGEAEEIVDALFGDLTLDGTPNAVTDPEGDGADRAGNATDAPPGSDILAADWFDIEGEIGEDQLDNICDGGLSTSSGSLDVVCPNTRTDLAAASRFVMVMAQFSGPVTLDNIDQFIFLWAEPGLETYLGAANDYNNDETDAIGPFRASPTEPFQFGRTKYRAGLFEFTVTNAAMMVAGPGYLAVLFPADTLLGRCLNVAVAAVTGNTIDKATLPDNPSGTFTSAPIATTTTSTVVEPTSSTAAPAPPEDEPTQTEDQGPGEATADETPTQSQGTNILLWIAILVLALGGVGFFIATRRSEECQEELAMVNAAKERLAESEHRLAEARRRLAAAPDSTALGVDVAEAEATVDRDRESVAGAEYIFNQCLGVEEPRGAGVSDVPETPSSRPMTVVEDPMDQPVVDTSSTVAVVDDTQAEPSAATPSPPPPPPATGTSSPGTKTDDPCEGTDSEWRPAKDISASWEEPVGTIQIAIDRPPDQFRDWLLRNGDFEEDEELPADGPVQVTVPLEKAAEMNDPGLRAQLLRTSNPRDQVQLEVRVAMQIVRRGCNQEWRCENGNWYRTGKSELTDKAYVDDGTEYRFNQLCTGGTGLATAISGAMKEIARRQNIAWEAEQALREECAK